MTDEEMKDTLGYTDRPVDKIDAEKKYYKLSKSILKDADSSIKRKAFAAGGLALASVGFAAIANSTGLSHATIESIMDFLKVANGIGISVSLTGIITALAAKKKALSYVREYEKGNIQIDAEKAMNTFLDRTEETLEKRGISK